MKQTDFHNILFCTDFSHNADFAFNYVIGFAEKQESVLLTIYHVIPEPNAQFWKTYIYEIDRIDEKAKHDIDQKIASEYLPHIPAGLNYKIVIEIGKEDEKILEYAEKHNTDLIIIGRQGHSSFRKVFFGNIAEKVVRKAHCPVMVIPADFENEKK